jgi:hypothetical protein
VLADPAAPSFAESFVACIAAEPRAELVNMVVVLYNADFSQRRQDIARRRLRFLEAYPLGP